MLLVRMIIVIKPNFSCRFILGHEESGTMLQSRQVNAAIQLSERTNVKPFTWVRSL